MAEVTDGQWVVILRRLDALELAIRERDLTAAEFAYDQARSAIERAAGTRRRAVDEAR